jgi:glycosyltransferase involved in cell wall biosynthesis
VYDWREVPDLSASLPDHDVLLLYRVPASASVLALISQARARGLVTCFEIDDLVCQPELYQLNTNLQALTPDEVKMLMIEATRLAATARHCDQGIGSTPAIATQLSGLCGSASVISNGLDGETLALAARPRKRGEDGRVRIFYGSGTRTHDRDLAVAAEALSTVLDLRSHVELWLAGPVRAAPGLAGHPRVSHFERRSFPDYMALLAEADISIAPLEKTAFNDAKSNIKFLEASALAIPSVCSPRAEFRAAINHGVTGYLAETTDDWLASLLALVDGAEQRREVGNAARASACERYDLDLIARTQLAEFLGRLPAVPYRRAVPDR